VQKRHTVSSLAFDFGLARIGVAVGETETGHAHPLAVIAEEASAVRFAAIEKLLTEWKPTGLVVGLPTHVDGTEHAMTVRCRALPTSSTAATACRSAWWTNAFRPQKPRSASAKPATTAGASKNRGSIPQQPRSS
jgi:hypothetical protein